jgi:hypothetical protein
MLMSVMFAIASKQNIRDLLERPLAILEWKWDKVEMDFIAGFP